MSLNALKEVTPVVYGTTGIKMWWNFNTPANATCFSFHWHEYIEVLRIQRGSLLLQYEEETYTVEAGQVVVISPNRLHGGVSGAEGVTYHALLFELSTFAHLSDAMDELLRPIAKEDRIFRPVYDDPAVTATLDRLLQNRLSDDPSTLFAVTGDLYYLLSALYTGGLLPNSAVAVTKTDFSEIVNYVDEHFSEPLSTATLASHFGYSEAYFCRRFKTTTGLPLLQYVQIRRLEHAQRLLAEGRYNVGTVAAKCGFSDISSFSHAFRVRYGMTPTAYARANKRIHQFTWAPS